MPVQAFRPHDQQESYDESAVLHEESADRVQLSKEELENHLSGTPSMFDQDQQLADTQNQETLKGQIEQLQYQIKGMQDRQQEDQEDNSRKQFEDTTGGTSGLDLENSELKNELTEMQHLHKQEDEEDDDYEADQNDLESFE